VRDCIYCAAAGKRISGWLLVVSRRETTTPSTGSRHWNLFLMQHFPQIAFRPRARQEMRVRRSSSPTAESQIESAKVAPRLNWPFVHIGLDGLGRLPPPCTRPLIVLVDLTIARRHAINRRVN
jgi:hypothetical protein